MTSHVSLQAVQTQAVAPREANMPAIKTGFFNVQSFELMQRVAKAFASSELVPAQYQGNTANCMIALDMAERIGAAPLMVMQNLYIVHGTPGWSSKFLIATVNACGRFSSLRYEWKGEPGKPDYGCRAWAIEKATGERLDGIFVTWSLVSSEGWNKKSGSKWNTMPDQMFIYRAAAFWQRAYAPELAMGLSTDDELHDAFEAERQPDGSYSVKIKSMRANNDAPATKPETQAKQTATVNTETGEVTKPAASSTELTAEEKAAILAQEAAGAENPTDPLGDQPQQRKTRAPIAAE